MTISKTKDLSTTNPSEASADAAIEPRTTRKTEPGMAVPNTTSAADVESRINWLAASEHPVSTPNQPAKSGQS